MYTFKKEERLCSTKLIEKLFSEGKSFMCYPFRISYIETKLESVFPVQVVFVVAKKRYRRANKRNLLKRRMRESYRHHKMELYSSLSIDQKSIALAISYIGKEIVEYTQINTQMKNLVVKLGTLFNATNA
jgi:ribonuclease P protein component